jgi:hypothetical protein
MFKKLKILTSLMLVASIVSLTFLAPVNSQANWWGNQFEWIGSFKCSDFVNRGLESMPNGCYWISANKHYDGWGKPLGLVTGAAKALKPIAMANRALDCKLYAKKVWNRDANYGEPGGWGEVKCWNKRW